MEIIGVGTKNPAKIEAVTRLVSIEGADAEIRSFEVPSRVSAMPMSDLETRQGAMNRARAVLEKDSEVSVGIGLEGGVSLLDGEMFLCNWGAMADRSGRIITAGGARIRLPEILAEGVRRGRELGDVADEYVHQKNVRKHGGTIGILTENRVTRSDMFFHILELLKGLSEHRKKR
ncbi:MULTISPECIES: DUF84 family protein [unclassified Sporolactobacillus]|uniref:DUF84 family protein n=1 Tax=unclassified Sporolactobacillus TaxID=2628533 RepID=UPI002367B138|nr:DUF84 family protein [Sporolactobacillus sp. CQH2019]MDD9149487.1 DUF84 family protein [Sporolactobacillus sp. CQH2019]